MTANYQGLETLDEDLVLNYEMGIDRAPSEDFVGPGVAYEGKYTEANARAYYAHWLRLVLGEHS